MLKNKGGLSHNIGQNPENFPRLRRGFFIRGCIFHSFYLGNHCFYSFLCYFFAPAAPKLLRVATETVRESNEQANITNWYFRRVEHIDTKRNASCSLSRCAAGAKILSFMVSKTGFQVQKHSFWSFLMRFRSGNTWQSPKIFGLRPGLWLNPPPLLKNVKIQGGG